MILRFRWRQLGAHVHCRVFVGRAMDGTFAKGGDVTLDAEEFKLLANGLVSARDDLVVQFKHEDEL